MQVFSHVSVFLSLIYGMAVAQLLYGFGQLLNAGARVRMKAALISRHTTGPASGGSLLCLRSS
jgi:hypothetical protein